MFPQVFGKYVLEREIASGGMAVVYLATLRGAGGFEKRLVVKQIRAELATDEAFVRRFVDEAKTTVELSHPNIAPVYELGVEQGVYYIAMELAEGVTLAELLLRGGPLSPAEGAHLGVEICRGLDYAHRRAGVVHRDVTPRNVVIDEEGHVRVIDFGIAAPVAEELRGQKVFGSPGHMPQEQIRGRPLTPATDVFAVGALLIEAWTGRAPFRRETADASERALGEPLPPLSDHDASLEPLAALVAAAVAFEPAERPQSAEALARPLRAFLRDVDAADVARRLGDRVRVAREPAEAPPGEAPGAATPATPSMRTPLGTRRVARLGSGARRSESEPPPSGEVASRATPVTAVMTGARASGGGRDSGSVTQTFAAREQLLEWTGERRSGPAVPVAPALPAPPERSRRWMLIGTAAVLASAGAGLLLRRGAGGVASTRSGATPATEPPRASARGASTPVGPTPQSSATRAAPEPSGSARVARVGPVPHGPPPAETRVASAAPVARPPSGEAGRLTLTSDLPATVVIEGRALGVTPLREVTRPPGRYRVTFKSSELEESVGTTVQLSAGQRLGVHAEFTRAAPAVRLR